MSKIMSTTQLQQITTAAPPFIAVFGEDGHSGFAVSVGPSFTCGEAEAVADMLKALGGEDEATQWLIGHALGDSEAEGDVHYVEGNGADMELRCRES